MFVEYPPYVHVFPSGSRLSNVNMTPFSQNISWPARHSGHTRHESTMQPTPARSPSRKRDALVPWDTTRPTISWPGTTGKWVVPQSSFTLCTSLWQMPQYRISIATSWGPGSRRSMDMRATGPLAVRTPYAGVFAVLVRKHGPPERFHLGDVKRVDRDEDRLHCRGVGGDAQLARDRRDPSGQLEVALAKPVVIGRDRDQPHDHAVVPQVSVRVVVIGSGELADCVHEPGACRERPGAEVRARSFAHHTPILDALGLVEPPRCDPVAHALNITRWMREWTHAIRPFTGQGSSSIDMAASGDPASSISSATQRREFLQAFGTRGVYSTSLAPRNSARFSIVSRIFNATSLSLGAPGSAWIELLTILSFDLSMFGSTRPMNRSPHRIGST